MPDFIGRYWPRGGPPRRGRRRRLHPLPGDYIYESVNDALPVDHAGSRDRCRTGSIREAGWPAAHRGGQPWRTTARSYKKYRSEPPSARCTAAFRSSSRGTTTSTRTTAGGDHSTSFNGQDPKNRANCRRREEHGLPQRREPRVLRLPAARRRVPTRTSSPRSTSRFTVTRWGKHVDLFLTDRARTGPITSSRKGRGRTCAAKVHELHERRLTPLLRKRRFYPKEAEVADLPGGEQKAGPRRGEEVGRHVKVWCNEVQMSRCASS